MEEALRLSINSTGQLSFPSDGYGRDVQISLENWTLVPGTGGLALPKSDLKFPHGAPLSEVVFIKGKGIYEKKRRTV